MKHSLTIQKQMTLGNIGKETIGVKTHLATWILTPGLDRGQGQNYSLQVGHQKEYTIQGPGFGDSVLAILWNKDFNSLHMQTFEQVRLFSI